MISLRPLILTGILSLAMLSSSTVRAQESEEDDLDLVSLMNIEVVTASKRAQKVSDAPAMVYVVTRQDILDRGYVNLVDVFRDLPGMERTLNTFSEFGTQASFRGASGNNKIVVLINGVRANPPGGEFMMFRNDISVRAARQIEITYGPGSTLYGQDAIFAVINIITERPKEGLELDALVAGGMNADGLNYTDAYARFGATLGKEESPVRISGYAQWIQSDLEDHRANNEQWFNTYFGNAGSLADGKSVRPDNGLNIMLRAETDNTSAQLWYRRSKRSSSEGGYGNILFFVDEAVWEDEGFTAEVKHSSELTENLSLETALSFYLYQTDPETRYVFPIGDSFFLDDYKYARGSGSSFEARLDWSPLEELNIMFGAVGQLFDIQPKATVPGKADPNLDIAQQGGAFQYYTDPNDPSTLTSVPRVSNSVYNNIGSYLEAQWKPTEYLGLIAGVRVDANSRFGTVPFSPRAAVIWSPFEELTTKFIFTRAFVAPPPYFGSAPFDNGFALNVTNPDLEPETATSFELNTTYNHRNFYAALSGYYTMQDNLLIQGDRALPINVVNETVYLDPAGTQTRVLTRSANQGKQTTYGADLYGRAQFGMVSGWLSVSVVNGETEGQGEGSPSGLSGLSPVNVRLGATIEAIDGLRITPSFFMQSSQENFNNPDNLDVGSPWEIGLHVRYQAIKGLDVFANAQNLTNNKYLVPGLLTPSPQEGIRAFAGLRYEYR